MNIIDDLLKGSEVEVTVAGLPPVTIALDSSKPSALISALRPSIVIRKNGAVLAGPIQPYGDPHAGVPWAAVAVAAGVLGVGALVFFAVHGA